jgi:carbonic anhydrase
VQWLVSPSIIPVPRTLLDQLKVINGGKNARPVQPLDGRRIELYVPSA